MNIQDYISISEEVKKALLEKRPVVALESTIISHGMPYPKNLETALNCQKIIRENNATPATIAIINGKLKVGLTDEEITFLAKEGRNITKASIRDIPYLVALEKSGATTVSSTMYIASLANIKIFATGGIGGVHRGASDTFDISSDLELLGKVNVSVVCAGAKAILDLGKTLEYLETKGVLVIGYNTSLLPAFYSSKSPYNVDLNISDPKTIAKIINTKNALKLEGGILITNPVEEQDEISHEAIDAVIEKAISEMDKLNITGKNTTPFLLAKIAELTNGESLETNIKLVYNNCKLASLISQDLDYE